MAKLKGPLFSLGATQQLGNALVYFPWKGLNCVRSYVIPANPRSPLQMAQRAKFADSVHAIHTAQALPNDPLIGEDIRAYALLAGIQPTPRTWFNEIVRLFVDQRIAGNQGGLYRSGEITPGVGSLAIRLLATFEGPELLVSGDFEWGMTRTAAIHRATAEVSVANTPWVANTAFLEDDMIFDPTLPAPGLHYQCIVPGTTGITEPDFPAMLGGVVVDGTVTWRAVPEFTAILSANIVGLQAGVLTYIEFKPRAPAALQTLRSGLYHSRPL